MMFCALVLASWPSSSAGQAYAPLPEAPKEYYRGLEVDRPAPRSLYGYPALDVDRRVYVELLQEGRFVELEALLGELAERVQDDVRWERHLSEAYRAFEISSGSAEEQLSLWARRRPGSAAPYYAMARYQLGRVLRMRAAGRLPASPEEVLAGRERLLQPNDRAYELVMLATEALRRAMATEPKGYMRYLIDLEIDRQTGWSDRTFSTLRDALREYPLSSVLREEAALNSSPQWGGTVALLDRVISEAESARDDNPRLAVLSGFRSLSEAHVASSFLHLPDALAFQNRTLQAGETAVFYNARAMTYFRGQDYVRAIESFNQALELRPQDQATLEYRYHALYQVSLHAPEEERSRLLDAAVADFELLLSMDPGRADRGERLRTSNDLNAGG